MAKNSSAPVAVPVAELVKARKPSAEESGFSLTRLEFFFKCSHKVIVDLTMLLPIVHLIWIRHPIISWKRVVSMTVYVVSLTISDIFTGVESVSTGVKIIFTGVEMDFTGVGTPSTDVEMVFTGAKSGFTAVEMVFTGVKTISTGVEMTLFPIFAPGREKILPSHTV